MVIMSFESLQSVRRRELQVSPVVLDPVLSQVHLTRDLAVILVSQPVLIKVHVHLMKDLAVIFVSQPVLHVII